VRVAAFNGAQVQVRPNTEYRKPNTTKNLTPIQKFVVFVTIFVTVGVIEWGCGWINATSAR
jgi:hypothetical protein